MRRSVALATTAAAVAVFVVLGVWISRGTPAWDQDVVDALSASGGLRAALGHFITAAEIAGYLLAVAVGLVLLRRRRWRDLAFYLGSIGGGLLLLVLLKNGFERPSINYRVKGYTGYAFPSGHALASVVVTLPAVLLSRRPAYAVLALAYVVAVGVALVARHAHYPTDILGGWCVGLAWVSILSATPLGEAARRRPPDDGARPRA